MVEEDIRFEQIYISYYARMKRLACEYVIWEEDAENIVHDVFADIWEKKELLSYPVNLVAFLFAAIKNKSIDFLRHQLVERQATSLLQKEHFISLQMNLNSLEALDQNLLLEKDIETIIQKAIESLPEKCRQIFIKSKIEGKKQKEIAAELNISINTIETQMGLAYKKLREELKESISLFTFLILLYFMRN